MPNKQIVATVTLCVAACIPKLPAKENKYLDNFSETVHLFGTASASEHIDHNLRQRIQTNYYFATNNKSHKNANFKYDFTDKQVGDFSVSYNPNASRIPVKFGFVTNLWEHYPNLDASYSLKFYLKSIGTTHAQNNWKVQLTDAQGNSAVGALDGAHTNGTWKVLSLPLRDLHHDKNFNLNSIKLCEFQAHQFPQGAKIKFDFVRFESESGKVVGVTDKTVGQRIKEAEATRSFRTKLAMQVAANNKAKGLYAPVAAFAKMMLNEDLETANQMLVDELNESTDANAWSLLHTPLYCRFYFMFSNRGGKFPGRMTPGTEKLLLQTLWNRTSAKNDIHWARQSTWHLDGSENHDLNAKACNLVTSRIFMNEPDYRNRIYPDYGYGGGYHYGHAGYYGPEIDEKSRHHGGRANLSDGKKYNAEDHYKAWLAYFKTYFRERAERGFFLEYGAYGYSKHTLNMFDLAQHYSGNDELSKMLDNFLTLYWAEWAQVSIAGVRGGPKTRHHGRVGGPDDKATADLISFHLGGPANAGVWWYWNLINDYKLPSIVWKMALDREGMGCFTYKARGIGEETNELPRPLGTERSLVVDTDSRILKSTYVTPDYTLGTQMDHPLAIHSHLSVAGRWHGMTFTQNPLCRIVPVAITDGKNKKGKKSPFDLEVMYHSVHHEQTLIIQQSRRWQAIHPDWFPSSIQYNQPVGLWLGNEWDKRIEKDGWIFVQSGNAYAAVRPVLWDEAYEKEHKKKTTGNQIFFNAPDDAPTVKLRTDCYRWDADQKLLIYEDNHTATIIKAGRKNDFPTLQAFMKDVLNDEIALYKTVVPGNNILVYNPSQQISDEIVFNCSNVQIPTIGNEPVDYSHPMTFDSPYLQAKYKTGKIYIKYKDESRVLDFSKKPWWAFWR